MHGEETESMRLLFQVVLSTDDETYQELARLQLLSSLKYFQKRGDCIFIGSSSSLSHKPESVQHPFGTCCNDDVPMVLF